MNPKFAWQLQNIVRNKSTETGAGIEASLAKCQHVPKDRVDSYIGVCK